MRRFLATLIAGLLVLVGLDKPASAAASPPFEYLNCSGVGVRYIYLTRLRSCQNVTDYYAIGWASLSQAVSNGHFVFKLEICDYDSQPFSAFINVANPDGSATDNVIEYFDDLSSGCFIRYLGYPIRKWRVSYPGYDASAWAPLPSS